MEKHVIVCGMPGRLQEFLQPFKILVGGQHEAKVVPLLFLWDGPVSEEQMLVRTQEIHPACPVVFLQF